MTNCIPEAWHHTPPTKNTHCKISSLALRRLAKIITTVQTYTRNISKDMSLLPSVLTMPINGNKWVIFFSGKAWYYNGDNDFTIWTTLHVQLQCAWLAVPDTDSHVTCSTDTGFSRDLQYLVWTLAWLVVKIQLFINCMQQQGFPIAYHTWQCQLTATNEWFFFSV